MPHTPVRPGAAPLALTLLLALASACAPLRPLPAREAPPTVQRFERFETAFDVPDATWHPDDVRVRARFTSPSGQEVTVGGFASGGRHRVRFTPTEVGEYRYTIEADGGAGARQVASGRLRAVEGGRRGFIRVRPGAPRQLAYDDGTPFHPLGENRFNVYDATWNHGQKPAAEYISYMASHGMNTLRLFIFTDCEREEPQPGPQPGCLEPRVGRFDEAVASEYDTIFEAAERHGIQVVLTLYAVGFTPNETWKSWEDNPYNAAAGGPSDVKVPDDFFDRPHLALGRLRYVLARWGGSPSLMAVDLLNEPEWDGNVGEQTWIPWAEALARVWHQEDPYERPVTAGSVGLHWNVDGDEHRWYASPHSDLVQWHLYGPDTYDVHALADKLTHKVHETWHHGKPVLLGEFGYGGEDTRTYEHTHVGLWVATFNGAGVLAHSAPPFTLDSDVVMTPERARHFKVLSDFLSRLDRGVPLEPLPAPRVDVAGARAWALGRPGYQALWLMAPKEGYGRPLEGARVTLKDTAPGRWRVRWWDDVSGALLADGLHEAGPEGLVLPAPTFTRHAVATAEHSPEAR